jgi:dihydropyrimidinase
MAEFDLVIRNGAVVTASETVRCDVGVREGIVRALGSDLPRGMREIDARQLLVLPGGVDSHAHVEQRGSPTVDNGETFASASLAAAFGGTTTMITHARQEKGGSLVESVADYAKRAKGSVIDYAFHLLVTDVTDNLLSSELPALAEEGHSSIKFFMATGGNVLNDDGILALLNVARSLGMQLAVHAENHAAIAWLTHTLTRLGHTEIAFNSVAKPIAVEREAVHRVLTYAEIVGVPIHVFHVTSAESGLEIERAQARGVQASGETCPQYLLLTEQNLNQPLEEAAKFVFGPPPRTLADQDALWSHLRCGTLDVISSDHSPHPYFGPQGKLAGAQKGGFATTPHGIPGIETRMMLAYSAGVATGRIDINRFVALTATNPAKRFGLYPQKGSIVIGGDADFVLWDCNRVTTLRNSELHHKVEYTPFEGMSVRGWPSIVVSRGDVIVENGVAAIQSARGRWLPRKRLSPSAMPPGVLGLASVNRP